MKVITLGLDGTILNPDSPVAERFKRYGEMVERMDVLIPTAEDRTLDLSEKVKIYGVGGSGKAVKLARLVYRFGRLHGENGYEVISTKDPYYLGLIAVYLARRYLLALEIQIHGFEKFNFMRRHIASFVLRKADSVRTVSERMKSKLVADFGIDPNRITVCPIFVDCERFAIIGRSTSHGERTLSPFTFITIGRLVPIKNISLQIEALSEIQKKHLARLIIVGEGPQMEYLKSVSKKFKVESQVSFVGSTNDITAYLSQADCFLMTSLEEGYGMAPVEAACFGHPVIMSDVGCANEIIIHGENGIIVPINDKVALVEAMDEIIENEALRTKIQDSNKNMSAQLPTLANTLNSYLKSWENAIVYRRGNI